MTKSLFSFLKFLIFTIYVAKLSYVWADQPETLSWAKTIPYGHEQKTTLEFYYHEFAFGENATVAWIAQAQPPQPNPPFTAFGNLYMVDGRLTVGPDVNSKLIGRAQGFFGSDSQTEENFMLGITYSLIDGIYNGSTFTSLGQNTYINSVRELSIIGATGLFRMARGYSLARIYSIDLTTGIIIVHYNVTLIHS
ncbi:dirigent protein 22-like [Beta vulgaris subsp. vulgaris]|uniref:dirigent protein 22-like n=1 Tax=Beta vulgaris subsp. vulgaris TaxID=3555 RepID=UPI002549AB0E|nr:dirigent protein 22-like [Beta vulgaris subsp. vulgaris]